MLGLGLSEYAPPVIYGLFFVVVFTSVFFRSAIGILFITFFLPLYNLLNKVIKSDLPLAKDILDILVIAMFLGWIFQSERQRRDNPIGPSPLHLPIFAFMSYSLLSLFLGGSYLGDGLFSDSGLERMAEWKNYMIIPMLYLLSYYNLRERTWKFAFFIVLFISLMATEFKFRETFQWFDRTHYEHAMRISGTLSFLSPNAIGSFHAIYSLFMIGVFLVDKHIWRRVVYAALIVGGIYCLMYSFSRGAYIGFVIGILFITIIRSRKLAIPFVILLFLWKSILPISVVERIESTILEEGQAGSTIEIGDMHLDTVKRAGIWEEGIKHFSQNPIFGTGFGTFGDLVGRDTHNMYLKTLAEQGLIGFFIYLWLYYLALKSAWGLYRDTEENLVKALGFGFLCAVVGSIVVNFFGDRWTYLQLSGIYWIIWALVDQENSWLKMKKGEMTASLEDRFA